MQLQKKRLLTLAIFISLLALFFIPFSQVTSGANATFSVYLILGNNNPTITWVQSSITETPNIGTNKTIYISFNATDPDGFQNLNNNSAKIYLNLTGEQSRYNTSCTVVRTNSVNTTQFNCSITIWYYDRAAAWTINASIYDISNSFANNTGTTMSISPLTAVGIDRAEIGFPTVNLGQTNAPADYPIVIDNLGNTNISTVNLTAYDLNKSSEIIDAGKFFANFTHNASLHTLVNATKVWLQNASVPRDLPSFAQNETLSIYVDVPAAGLTAGTFRSMYNWTIDVS
jgi:hypothetical protein